MDATECPVKAAEDECVRIEDDQVGATTDHSSTTTDWQVQTDQTGRLFYISHQSQTSQWIPAPENWDTSSGLPYGWESAVDKHGKIYYINHVEKVTQREDPRDDPDYVEPPKPRDVELTRDPALGFGFVAGSEKPVIVRFVTEGGPCEDKLLPGDQIIKINSEDVKSSPREYVIELVRSCKNSIVLTVCQPYTDNSARKSALLTAAKKARLKNNPSRVRFAEAITVNGTAVTTPSTSESYIPFMPNVLKVFLENGQTKSFKYDNKTTIKDVLNSLQEKLSIMAIDHFALVLQNMKSPSHGKMTLLQEHESLAEIAARPSSQHFKCLFRVTFVPQDAYDLLQKDAVAFEYFYMQCCNDVVKERFASELKYDVALRLAALHLHQHSVSNALNNKTSIKSIQKECGLEKFVPHCLLESMKGKDLRKMLSHYSKLNACLMAPGQKQMTELQAKLHYMKMISELRSFGGKCFIATIVPYRSNVKYTVSGENHTSPSKWDPIWEKKTEAMILVGPRCGVSVVTNIKMNTKNVPMCFMKNLLREIAARRMLVLATLADYEELDSILVTREGDSMQRVDLVLSDPGVMPISLSMLNEDVHDFIALVEGYFRLYVNGGKNLLKMVQVANNNTDPDVPIYHGQHMVHAETWSYKDGKTADETDGEKNEGDSEATQKERLADFSIGPPGYREQLDYINKLSEELGIKCEDSVVVKKMTTDKSQEDGRLGSLESLNFTDEESRLALSLLVDNQNSVTEDVNKNDTDVSTTDTKTTSTSTTNVTWENSDANTTVMVINRTKQSNGDRSSGATGLKTFASDPALRDRSLSLLDNSREKNLQILQSLSRGNITRASDGNLNLTRTSRTDLFIENHQNLNLDSFEGQNDVTMSDEEEEEDTESTLSGGTGDLEKKPLLPSREKLNGQSEDELGIDNEHMMSSCATSESDTDSLSTPTDSPAKKRLSNLNNTSSPKLVHAEPERPQSFGLRSPDQLPTSEAEFENIATSFGLHSPDQLPVELLQASYNPRMFCDGGFYLDPDIIDLTLIPPPKTPEQENLIDFTVTTNTPPPGFSDDEKTPSSERAPHDVSTDSDTSLPQSAADLPSPIRTRLDELVRHDQDLSHQLLTMDALMLEHRSAQTSSKSAERESGMEDEGDSGNETISSEMAEYQTNGMHDYLASNAECLYPAQFLYQKPESSSNTADLYIDGKAGLVTGLATRGQHQPAGAEEEDIEALIARLTVPPPPKDSPESVHHVSSDDDQVDSEIMSDIQSVPFESLEVAPKKDGVDVNTTESSLDDGESMVTSEEDVLQIPPPPHVPTLDESPAATEQLDEDLKIELQTQIDEELQALIVPPPPLSESTELIDIPVVPPVNIITPPSSVETSPSCDNNNKKFRGNKPLLIEVQPCLDPVRNLTFVDGDDTIVPSQDSDKAQIQVTSLNKLRSSDSAHEGSKFTCDHHDDQKLMLYLKGSSGIVNNQRTDSSIESETSSPGSIGKPVVAVQGTQRSNVTSPKSPTDNEQVKFNSLKPRRRPPPPPPPPRRSSMTNILAQEGAILSITEKNECVSSEPTSSVRLENNSLTTDNTQLENGSSDQVITTTLNGSLVSHESTGGNDESVSIDPSRSKKDNISKLKLEKCNSDSLLDKVRSHLRSYHSPTIDRKQFQFDFSRRSGENGDSDSSTSTQTRHTASSPVVSPLLQRRTPLSRSGSSGSDSTSPGSGATSPRSPSATMKRAGRTMLPLTRSALTPSSTANKEHLRPPFLRSSSSPDTSTAFTNVLKPRHNITVDSRKNLSKLPHLVIQKNGEQTEIARTNGDVESPLCTSSPHQSPVSNKLPAYNTNQKYHSNKALSNEIKLNENHHVSSINGNNSPESSKENVMRTDSKHCHHEHIPTGSTHVTCPVVANIMQKAYKGDATFQDANDDVDILISDLSSTLEFVKNADFQRHTGEFQKCKDVLVSDSRQFVTDSKLLVSSATQNTEKLIQNVNTSMHTLARISDQCQATIYTMTSDLHLHQLVSKVKDVANAYKVTVNAAQAAAGKPLSDPNMKVLMRQATNLASILSSLMRLLKSLDED